MKAEDFFGRVRLSLEECGGDDPTGVEYFIGDMEKLFDEWEEEKENDHPKSERG